MSKLIYISILYNKLVKQLMPNWASMTPHLCVPDHGGSSRPSLGGGLGCPGHPVPAGLNQSPSQGGCRAAADLRGEAAVGREARERHGRGAVPGAAAAVSRKGDRQIETKWVRGKRRGETTH